MDPRASISPLGLTRQFALASKLAGMMNKTLCRHGSTPESKNAKLHADLIALNGDLATAYDVVEGADRAPTTQAAAAVARLQQRMNALFERNAMKIVMTCTTMMMLCATLASAQTPAARPPATRGHCATAGTA